MTLGGKKHSPTISAIICLKVFWPENMLHVFFMTFSQAWNGLIVGQLFCKLVKIQKSSSSKIVYTGYYINVQTMVKLVRDSEI